MRIVQILIAWQEPPVGMGGQGDGFRRQRMKVTIRSADAVDMLEL
jgi:hypothetical protein